MSVQVTKTDRVIQVKSSYNEAFIKAAKQIAGRWNADALRIDELKILK